VWHKNVGYFYDFQKTAHCKLGENLPNLITMLQTHFSCCKKRRDSQDTRPGPKIASYNATSSLARFESKKLYSTLENVLAYYNASVVAVNSKVAGLAPGVF
jgi:hypothetical protein